ncbi:MAG: hypothetical protein HGA59_04780 [Chlorobiaceae bacterium]|nr:hypothetical protein [Chlorobiaceae bacterium]NTV15910.1 hypothetical protein [Chlorobiaceae bacterium]
MQKNTAEAAISYQEGSSGRLIIISKVSGRYLEICPSIYKHCAYRRAEANGFNYLKRKQ